MTRVGRPSHKPTSANRRLVEQAIACGQSADNVATALGISSVTLRKCYANELTYGRARKFCEVVGLLFKQGRKGNVSSLKTLVQMISNATLMETPRREREREAGKKEALNIEANNPPPSWAKLLKN
jgi:hypothetical protein